MSTYEQVSYTTSAGAAGLPPTVSVEQAGEMLGIGRTLAYRLAARGELPVPVVRIGRSLKVPTAPLLALLGLNGTGSQARPGAVAGDAA